MQITPYLFLDGRCEEAITFYQKAIGAKVAMCMRYKEGPPPEHGQHPPGMGDKIMHANLLIGDQPLMLSDGHCQGKPRFEGMAVSLTVKTDAEAEKLFAGLSAGGQPTMPMAATFYASRFGMVIDKFGVQWMVLTEGPAKSAVKPAAKAAAAKPPAKAPVKSPPAKKPAKK